MLIYNAKTGTTYSAALEFQRDLKNVWATLVLPQTLVKPVPATL